MIPYDDLVAALGAWRKRQGLNSSQMSAVAPPPSAAPAARTAPPPRAASSAPVAPTTRAQAAPRTAPPAPPPRSRAPSMPPPLAPAEPLEPVEEIPDETLFEPDHLEGHGGDFALGFPQDERDSETALGAPPHRDSMATDPVGHPNVPRRDEDW